MRADLHVHSTASDGTLSPRELVELASSAGLTHLAIADHDSVDSIADAEVAAAATSLTIIPAVELSSTSSDGRDVHVLGYFIDPSDCGLRDVLADLRVARLRRAEAIIASLAEAGFIVCLNDVLSHSNGGTVGRSHVARALVSAGHAESLHDAFDRLIGRGRPHYIAKDARLPEDAISTIRSAGGFAVIAHPGIGGFDDLIAKLAKKGLRGVEAYHADHTPRQRVHYARIAESLGLLTTGGSDFHGPGAPNPSLGSVDWPSDALAAFLAAGRARS